MAVVSGTHDSRRRHRSIVALIVVLAALVPTASAASAGGPRVGRTLATISIPAIDIKVSLVYGITDDALSRGLGLWPGTALPGKPGNAVIAGHRTTHGAPMRDIDRLQVGDRIFVTSVGATATVYEYRITKRQIVKPDAMWITRKTRQPTLTIFACHPPHSISYRFVVFAKLISTRTLGLE